MRSTSICAILAVCTCLAAFEQPGRIMGGSASKDGVSFAFETRLEPPSPPLASPVEGGVMGGRGAAMHRFMSERKHKKYFGYDLLIEPLEEAKTFRVTIQPLSLDAKRLGLANPSEWSPMPLPRYPAPQLARRDDTIILELLINPATGQKIVDYLVVGGDRETFHSPAGHSRDISVDDVELRVRGPQLTINGKAVESKFPGNWEASGSIVGLLLPDRGRFLLSLTPRERWGFRKAGEVRGSVLSFRWGVDTLQLKCGGPIAPGYAAYNLYIFHDPSYGFREEERALGFVIGTSDHPGFPPRQ